MPAFNVKSKAKIIHSHQKLTAKNRNGEWKLWSPTLVTTGESGLPLTNRGHIFSPVPIPWGTVPMPKTVLLPSSLVIFQLLKFVFRTQVHSASERSYIRTGPHSNVFAIKKKSVFDRNQTDNVTENHTTYTFHKEKQQHQTKESAELNWTELNWWITEPVNISKSCPSAILVERTSC